MQAFEGVPKEKGGQPKPTANVKGLLCFAVLAGHPAHAAVDHHRVPAVFSRCHPFKGVTVLGSGDAAVLRAVAGANVDSAADAGDHDLPASRFHPLRNGSAGLHLLRRLRIRGGISLVE